MISLLFALAARPQTPQPPDFLRGTIVSVRAGLLVVKPMLRPKLVRVAVVAKTNITGMDRTRANLLKPGWAVAYVGQIEGSTFANGFLAAAPAEIPVMKTLPFGGIIKSAEPFIVHDRSGKDVRLEVGPGVQVNRLYAVDKNALLIGSRIDIEGHYSPDGVLQADDIQPESEYAASGTMFGKILSRKGSKLTLIPRFTNDRVVVTLAKDTKVQAEHRLDPDTVKVGQRVTVWGLFSGDPHPTPARAGLLAIAIITGSGRYPKSSRTSGGAELTGRIESLVPNVVLRTDDGRRIPIVVPAQLIIARLTSQSLSDLRPGSEAMFLLKPIRGGGFSAGQVILNASPWVGYGN